MTYIPVKIWEDGYRLAFPHSKYPVGGVSAESTRSMMNSRFPIRSFQRLADFESSIVSTGTGSGHWRYDDATHGMVLHHQHYGSHTAGGTTDESNTIFTFWLPRPIPLTNQEIWLEFYYWQQASYGGYTGTGMQQVSAVDESGSQIGALLNWFGVGGTNTCYFRGNNYGTPDGGSSFTLASSNWHRICFEITNTTVGLFSGDPSGTPTQLGTYASGGNSRTTLGGLVVRPHGPDRGGTVRIAKIGVSAKSNHSGAYSFGRFIGPTSLTELT